MKPRFDFDGALKEIFERDSSFLEERGRVPIWAQDRLANASERELGKWCQKILVADTIEGVIGKR